MNSFLFGSYLKLSISFGKAGYNVGARKLVFILQQRPRAREESPILELTWAVDRAVHYCLGLWAKAWLSVPGS